MYVCHLPGGFRLNGAIHKEVTLREMSGVEEDILLDQRKKGNHYLLSLTRRLSEILALCTVSVGDTHAENNRTPDKASRMPFLPLWESALVGDRMRAIVALRELSLGPTFVFPDECPSCKAKLDRITVALDDLTVTPYFPGLPEGDRDAALLDETKTAELPSGRSFEWRFLTGKDEEALEAALNNSFKNNPDRMVTYLTSLRVVAVDGSPLRNDKGVMDDSIMRNMSARDRSYIRSFFDEVDGGVESTIDIQCEECGVLFHRKLDINKPSFFFPSGVK